MKKGLLVLLVLITLFAFASCGYYSQEETVTIVDALLTKEAEMNLYVYGDGFETAEDPGDDVNATYQKYYTVSADSRYLTLSALKTAVNEVIASTAREEIYAYAFDGLSTDDTSSPPRFAEDENGNLQINVADHLYSQMRSQYLLSSAKVKRSNQTHIKAQITVVRYDKDGNAYTVKKDIELLLENGQWRLSNPSMVIGVTDSVA